MPVRLSVCLKAHWLAQWPWSDFPPLAWSSNFQNGDDDDDSAFFMESWTCKYFGQSPAGTLATVTMNARPAAAACCWDTEVLAVPGGTVEVVASVNILMSWGDKWVVRGVLREAVVLWGKAEQSFTKEITWAGPQKQVTVCQPRRCEWACGGLITGTEASINEGVSRVLWGQQVGQ